MDLKIIKKQDNPLLSRTEIEAEASFFNEPTPKKEDIKKKISSMEKADEKLVVVKNVYGNFGAGKASVLAYVYKSEDKLKKIEPKKKEKKEATEGAAKEAPKEEAKEKGKEEAKAPLKEETKEAPKEEPKKEEPKKESPKKE